MKYIVVDSEDTSDVHSCCNLAAVVQHEYVINGDIKFFMCECPTIENAELIAKALNKIMELN